MTKNAVAKIWNWASGATGDGATYNSNEPFGGPIIFQLPTGNFVDSKLTMEVASPRPDIERGTNSRYSFMHSGMENAMPIVILGGAYPFKYEIIANSGTANTSTATIGKLRTYNTDRSWYGSANQKDYGIFRWTPTGDDGNSYSFTIRITGQDGVFRDIIFSGLVQDSRFIFVDPVNGEDITGTGTLANPWKSNTTWNMNDPDDATYKDNFVVWRAGLQTPIDTGKLAGSTKPRVFIAFEGDAQPTYDGTIQDHAFLSGEDSNDFFWGGIRVNGTRSDLTESRYFEIFGAALFDRAVFWNSYFFDASSGTVGTDNEAWISSRSGAEKKYFCSVGNTFDTAPLSTDGNGFDSTRLFNFRKCVLEHNIIKNFSGQTLIQPKDECFEFSIRANDMWEGNTAGIGVIISNQGGGDTQEVCWNWILNTDAIRTNSANSAVDMTNFFVFRNTLAPLPGEGRPIDLFAGSSQPFSGVVEIESNVLLGASGNFTVREGSTPLSPNPADDAQANIWFTNGNFDNQFFDTDTQTEVNITTGLLQNAGLDFLGTDGAEISA